MFAVLQLLGLRGSFIKALQVVHSSPFAQVKLTHAMSPSFIMYNGTRQGCSSSPLLFILCLESMAEAIRSNENIQGIPIRHKE